MRFIMGVEILYVNYEPLGVLVLLVALFYRTECRGDAYIPGA